jgi:regulator of cell morphogenesis and NO signaling
MRALTQGYAAPPEACGSWRALYGGLAAFEADLHRHVHLENNVLFPRVREQLERGGGCCAHA